LPEGSLNCKETLKDGGANGAGADTIDVVRFFRVIPIEVQV
jgi:hypothetical protein